jgi:hypothetical protein
VFIVVGQDVRKYLVCEQGWRVSVLVQIARHSGKRIVRISTDQTDCADDYDENYGKHHSVFGNILACIAQPNVS